MTQSSLLGDVLCVQHRSQLALLGPRFGRRSRLRSHFDSLCKPISFLFSAIVNPREFQSIKSCRLEKELVGHGGAVSAISICSEFSVVVSGCESGRLFLWDLNKYSFLIWAYRKYSNKTL